MDRQTDRHFQTITDSIYNNNLFPGQLLSQVKIPASMTTSMCFGGERQSALYVTTCSVDYDANNTPIVGEPDAGKIFSVTCPQDNSFKGFNHYFFG
jgi:sugar lactone lactonase YvrE